MPSTYTPRLRLTLPATGENSGTWSELVNAGITGLIDAAIAGYASVAMTDADYTLTSVNGAADQARQMMLNMTGTLTAARNVICPTTSKMYVIKNSTTGGFAITLKTASGTGVLIPNGSSALLMCDGTNVVESDTHASTLTIGTTAVNTYGGKLVVYAGDTVFADALTASGTSAPRIGSATQALVVKTNTGAGAAAEVARFDGSGSLLVGKTSTTKTEKLGVRGAGATTPPTNLSSMNGALMLVESNQANTAYGAVGYQDNTGGGAAIVFGRGSSYQTQIAFYTNPLSNAVDGGMQERGRFDADGNFGVGLTPTYRLDVQSGATASAARFSSTGTSVLARFADGTAETGYIGSGTGLLSGLARTDYGIAANTGNALVLGSNNTERMRINSAGNVGIGQPSPQTSLGFANSATISWGTTNYPYVSGDQVANTLIFGTQATERMRINSAGNVGIGTNNPLTKLDVSSSGDTTLRVNKLGVADVYLTAGANGIFGIDSAYAILSFGVNNVERARITDAGDFISTVPTTPPTLSTNGQMVMNLTSNTNLRISVRGTDGVTRVANLTLA